MSDVAGRGRLRRLPVLLATLAVAILVPSVGGAATIEITCVNEKDLQAAIDAAAPFDTILVNGSCAEENLTIGSDKVGLTLNGKKVAEIHDSQTGVGAAAISVRGATQVTIRDFLGLTTNAADGVGVVVVDGASARIIGNTIAGNQIGILVQRNAQARINGNTIRSNSDAGVRIRETSSARISPDPSPANTIQDNGVGIEVLHGSSARIFANQIVDNQTAGVRIDRGSQADITSNTIDGNGVNGIEVLRSSSAVVGSDTVNGPPDGPNTGTSTGFAVLCSLNSSVDGRLGALNGTNRRKVEAIQACVNSTIP